MASFKQYTAGGGASEAFSIPTFASTEIKVYVDQVLKSAGTHYNITSYTSNGGTVTWTSGNIPSNPSVVRIVRDTDVSSAKAIYAAGSSVKARDLNDNQTQVLRSLEEDDHLIQRSDIEPDAIDGTLIADDAINSEHYAADSIDTEHYAPNSVDTAAIAADAVATSELADDAVTTAKLGNLQVTTAKIANDAITSAKIVNGTIVDADVSGSAAIAHTKLAGAAGGKVLLGNSGNVVTATTVSGDVTISNSGVTAITAGSIVEGDIANNAVTMAKLASGTLPSDIVVNADNIAANSITASELADNSVTADQIAAGSVATSELADAAVTTVKLGNLQVTTEKLNNDAVTSDKILANAVTSSEIADAAVTTANLGNLQVTTEKLNNNAVTAAKIADEVIVTASEQAAHSVNDTSFFTTSAAEARFFNASTGETIKDGQTFPDNDTTIATTAAINDRIIDLVDDVGGFVPIANETSFPAANPDVNNGAGTLVSIKALASNLTSNGSGVATIANGAGSGNTVTINGLANSTTYAATFGMIVETTSTLHTYTFHRQVPKATEVTTVAGSISNVNTVAGDISNVNAVAGNATNINAVAGNASNINSAVSNASNINSAVSNASNINSAVSNASNINTTAGSISNVNTVAGSISNVNSVASNMSTVNDFAARYRTGANNPTSSLDTGDLFFNTTANELKVYNGSAWQGGVTASGSFATVTGNTFTGANTYNDNVKLNIGTGTDLQIFHDGSFSRIKDTATNALIIQSNEIRIQSEAADEAMAKFIDDGAVELYYDNVKKFETTSTGAKISGTLFDVNTASADSAILKLNTNVNACEVEARVSGGENNLVLSANNSVDSLKITGAANGTVDLPNDSQKLRIGAGSDLNLYHDGTNSYIDNNSGNLIIDGGVNTQFTNVHGEDTAKFIANGAVELYYDNSKKLETTADGIGLNDSVKAAFGNGGDLKIYHSGSHSYIKDTGTGDLFICSDDLHIGNAANDEDLAVFKENAQVELYYDNSKKLETSSTGISVTGQVNAGTIHLTDGDGIHIGNSNDLKIYHDGTNSYINDAGTGHLNIKTNGTEISFTKSPHEQLAKFITDGACELYYDNSKKFETASYGAVVTGTFQATGNIDLFDNGVLNIGTGGDLKLYHDGSNSFIKDAGTGSLWVYSNDFRVASADGSENIIKATENGAVELYHNNSKKFETYSAGCVWSGNLKNETDGVNEGIYFGASNDLGIYHNGTHNFVDSNNGHLYLRAEDSILLQTQSSDKSTQETLAKFLEDGACELYYDNSKKFATKSSGVDFFGDTFMPDSEYAHYGTGNDMYIGHDGTNSTIDNGTGDLLIRQLGSSGDIYLDPKSGERGVKVIRDGAVELYHNGNKQVFTIDGGMNWQDNKKAEFGNSGDLKIYHNGSASYIQSPSHALYIQATTIDIGNGAGTEPKAKFFDNGAVELYYDNSKKFETTSGGAKVTGALLPAANDTYDLGSSSYAWNNLYVNDLHFSNNPNNPNSVDGTWGDWTLQEGENDIFMLNNRTGKKYKMALQEVV